MWADSHCHLQDPRLDPARAEILHTCRQRGISRWVVNATRESDWASVRSLCAHNAGFHPAFGLHPWWIRERSAGWEHQLRRYLMETPNASVGETGLDLWMSEPDLDDQKHVLQIHLQLARELNRPVSLHCLRAWSHLLKLIQNAPPLPAGFLLHSYAGPADQIPEWVRLGARFSFSPAFLAPKRTVTRELFSTLIPLSRLLVETDCPDMAPPAEFNLAQVPSCSTHEHGPRAKPLNHPLNLLLCIEWICRHHALSESALQSILEENFQRLFGFTPSPPNQAENSAVEGFLSE
jgi:TatD DNase family protein